jgi:cell division protein FtsB
VHELQRQLQEQRQQNVQEKLRNDRMAGEVQDLQEGTAAVEERARYEMGMLKDGEMFVQFVPPSTPASAVPGPTVANITSTRGEVSAQPMMVVPNPVSRGSAKKAAHAKKSAKKKQGAHG